jgi:hypothetical protein
MTGKEIYILAYFTGICNSVEMKLGKIVRAHHRTVTAPLKLH